MRGSIEAGAKLHPQKMMELLHISYKYAIVQSIIEKWWFVDCEYSCELPKYLTVMEFTDEDRAIWLEGVKEGIVIS